MGNKEKVSSEQEEKSKIVRTLYEQFMEMAAVIGMPRFSDEYCAQLIAVTLCYGGNREDLLYNYKLRNDVYFAQKRLNILGGEVPRCGEKIREYVAVLMKQQHPEWLIEIEKRYNIKFTDDMLYIENFWFLKEK